jgi:Uma2 family endonuclease
MATEARASTPTPPAEPGNGLVPYRLTVEQFLKLIAAGVFPDRARIELIGGLLVKRMTKYTPHNWAVSALAESLRRLVGPGHVVREEKSLVIGRRSRPEPDVVVLRGPWETYRSRDPESRDVVMLVEVADSTYAKDRGRMWRLYAGAGIPTYWVVNLPRKQVEVYTEPSGRGRSAAYRQEATFGPDAEVPVLIEGREAGKIAVKDVLP